MYCLSVISYAGGWWWGLGSTWESRLRCSAVRFTNVCLHHSDSRSQPANILSRLSNGNSEGMWIWQYHKQEISQIWINCGKSGCLDSVEQQWAVISDWAWKSMNNSRWENLTRETWTEGWLRRLWNSGRRFPSTLSPAQGFSSSARDLWVKYHCQPFPSHHSNLAGSPLDMFPGIPCQDQALPTVFPSAVPRQVKKSAIFSLRDRKCFFIRFMFEKTFATCLTLDHLQGALTADNVYMELLQVSSLAQGSHGLYCVLPGDSRPPGCCSRYIWDLGQGTSISLPTTEGSLLFRGGCRPADGADQRFPGNNISQGVQQSSHLLDR